MLEKIINLMRIKNWFHILGVPFLGYFFVSASYHFIGILLLFLIAFFLLSFCYSYDVCFDTLNKKKSKNSKYPAFRKSLMLSKVFLLIAVFVSIIVSIFTFFLVVVEFILVFVYYREPFRLKKMPFVVTIINATYYSILFLIGASLKGFDPAFIYPTVLIFIATIPLRLFHEITDYKDDLKNKIFTTAIKLGVEKTNFFIYLVFCLLSSWSILMVYKINISPVIFFITIIYSIMGIFIIKYGRIHSRTMITLRIASILYGLSLLIIYYFIL